MSVSHVLLTDDIQMRACPQRWWSATPAEVL